MRKSVEHRRDWAQGICQFLFVLVQIAALLQRRRRDGTRTNRSPRRGANRQPGKSPRRRHQRDGHHRPGARTPSTTPCKCPHTNLLDKALATRALTPCRAPARKLDTLPTPCTTSGVDSSRCHRPVSDPGPVVEKVLATSAVTARQTPAFTFDALTNRGKTLKIGLVEEPTTGKCPYASFYSGNTQLRPASQ